MQNKDLLSLRNNALWLLGSFIISFGVWFFATIQANPIREQQFRNIPIQIEIPEGFIITNDPLENAQVLIRAQNDVLNLLTSDDIVIRATLDNDIAGTYTIPLIASSARSASIDTQPTQITLTIEQELSQQKPVEINITELPAVDLDFESPTSDILQVRVRGANDLVTEVARVEAIIDLSERRASFETDVQLTPVNADGELVNNVTIEPRTARINVNIVQRDDVQLVSVRPNVLIETLPTDYVLRSISYAPQTIFISGSPDALGEIGNTIETDSISLEGQTGDFEIVVPLALPNSELLILSDESFVRVSIGITPQSASLQFDNIPITLIGIDESQVADVSLDTISVVINAPVIVLNDLTASDIEAVIDLNNLSADTYELEPTIIVKQGQVVVDSVTPLPSFITVTINDLAEQTPEPESTLESTPQTNVSP